MFLITADGTNIEDVDNLLPQIIDKIPNATLDVSLVMGPLFLNRFSQKVTWKTTGKKALGGNPLEPRDVDKEPEIRFHDADPYKKYTVGMNPLARI